MTTAIIEKSVGHLFLLKDFDQEGYPTPSGSVSCCDIWLYNFKTLLHSYVVINK